MDRIVPCPECGSRNLYRSKEISAGGGHAPDYLPGLGRSFLFSEKFYLVVCQDCGLSRFFARAQAREKLSQSSKWTRV
jgi:predicted nucleic-acid-binding Zn-ribbon protein